MSQFRCQGDKFYFTRCLGANFKKITVASSCAPFPLPRVCPLVGGKVHTIEMLILIMYDSVVCGGMHGPFGNCIMCENWFVINRCRLLEKINWFSLMNNE